MLRNLPFVFRSILAIYTGPENQQASRKQCEHQGFKLYSIFPSLLSLDRNPSTPSSVHLNSSTPIFVDLGQSIPVFAWLFSPILTSSNPSQFLSTDPCDTALHICISTVLTFVLLKPVWVSNQTEIIEWIFVSRKKLCTYIYIFSNQALRFKVTAIFVRQKPMSRSIAGSEVTVWFVF